MVANAVQQRSHEGLGGTVDEVKEQQRGQRSALEELTVTLAEDVVYERSQKLSAR